MTRISLTEAKGNVEARAVLKALLDKPDTEARPPILLVGPDGTGKSTLAKAYAYSYGCETRTLCGECTGCKMPEKSHLTVRSYFGTSMTEKDAAGLSSLGALLLHQKTLAAVVIDRADMLRGAVAVALARSLDLLGSRVAVVLTAVGTVDDALLSRVLPVKTRPLSRTEALDWLNELGYEGDGEKIYRASSGVHGRLLGTVALQALSGGAYSIPDPEEYGTLTLRAVGQRNMAGGMAALTEYISSGGAVEELFNSVRADTLEILRYRVSGEAFPKRLWDIPLDEAACIAILKVLRDPVPIYDTFDKAHVTLALMLDAVAPNLYAPAPEAEKLEEQQWDGDFTKLVETPKDGEAT